MKMNNEMSPPYTILFADDHQLIREAISDYINNFKEFTVIGQAANGAQLKEMIISGTVPHLVLLDIEMPVLNGYETAKWLKKNYPSIKIVMLSAFDSEASKAIAFQHGVDGFLTKCIEPALMKVVLKNIVTGSHNQKEFSDLSFSNKELEFLKWLCDNLKYEEIAKKMHTSLRSVEHLREDLFEKLSVNTWTALVLYAVRNGIVTK